MRKYTIPRDPVPNIYIDLLQQTHVLIAGKTGSGKSVIINGMIYAALHSPPNDADGGKQFILIDPKRVELADYKPLQHTIYYASEPAEMITALNCAMSITETRYKIMQRRRERKYSGGDIYIIIDEFADLMTTNKKQVQPLIQRLAQIGRAARVHIILATQTPISAVIPTQIKCNFDSRIGLKTRSKQDSRNIIDRPGLETIDQFGIAWYMSPQYDCFVKVPMIDETSLQDAITAWAAQNRIFHRRRD